MRKQDQTNDISSLSENMSNCSLKKLDKVPLIATIECDSSEINTKRRRQTMSGDNFNITNKRQTKRSGPVTSIVSLVIECEPIPLHLQPSKSILKIVNTLQSSPVSLQDTTCVPEPRRRVIFHESVVEVSRKSIIPKPKLTPTQQKLRRKAIEKAEKLRQNAELLLSKLSFSGTTNCST